MTRSADSKKRNDQRVLPAWATITIALGGSLIGALAGVLGGYFTLRTTRFTIGHEEREAWRSRLIEAAQDFSVAWTGLFQELADPLRQTAPLDDQLWKKIDDATLDVARKFLRIALLFGDSPTQRYASEADQYLGPVMAFLRSRDELDELRRKEDQDLALKRWDLADQSHSSFVDAAHDAVRFE